MKKFIGLVLTFMLICTFCIPVFAAESFHIDIRANKVIPQGTYSALYIDDSAKGTIENGKTVTLENTNLIIKGTLDIEGKLEGTVGNVTFVNAAVIIGENGCFQLTFAGNSASSLSQNFIALLKNNGIAYDESTDASGNVVISSHEHNFIIACTGCDYQGEFVTAAGSILSAGYPEIFYGIGGIAIGAAAALLFSRKKKVAVSSTAAEEKEY